MNTELLWSRYGIEFWKCWYGRYDCPSFVVIDTGGSDTYFPSFDNPNAGQKALEYVRLLRSQG